MSATYPIGRGTTLAYDTVVAPSGFTVLGCCTSITPPMDSSDVVYYECLNQDGETQPGSDTASTAEITMVRKIGDVTTDQFIHDAKANATAYTWQIDNPDSPTIEQFDGVIVSVEPQAISGKGELVTVNFTIARTGPKTFATRA